MVSQDKLLTVLKEAPRCGQAEAQVSHLVAPQVVDLQANAAKFLDLQASKAFMLWPSQISWNSLLVPTSSFFFQLSQLHRVVKTNLQMWNWKRLQVQAVTARHQLQWCPQVLKSWHCKLKSIIGGVVMLGWGKASKVSLRLQSIFGRGTCGSKVHGPRHWKTRPLIHYSQSWPDPVQSVTVRRIIIGKNTERIWSFAAWRRKLTRAIYRRGVRSFPNDSLSVNPPTPITCFFAAEDCRQESSDKRGDGHVMWWSYFPPAETSDFAAIKL